MLCKLIVWGEDREQCRKRLSRALGEFVLEGVHNNITFHRWLVNHPEFAKGNLSTHFLDEHFTAEALEPGREATEVAILAAALHAREQRLKVVLPQWNAERAQSRWKWSDRPRTSPRSVKR